MDTRINARSLNGFNVDLKLGSIPKSGRMTIGSAAGASRGSAGLPGLNLQSLKDNPAYVASADDNKKAKLAKFAPLCSEVFPGLFVAGNDVACNLATLKAHSISHVVNAASSACANYFQDLATLAYLTLDLKDHVSENILLVLDEALAFIDDALKAGGRVLVHCWQGVSRSGAIAIAYVMKETGKSFAEAKELVRAARGIINPNGIFECQLQAWQKKGGQAAASAAPFIWAPAAGLAASGTSLAGDASARAWAGNGCGVSDAEQTGNWRGELDALADVPLFQNSDSDDDGSDGGSSCSGSFTGSDDPEDASGNSWSLMSRQQGVPSLGLSFNSSSSPVRAARGIKPNRLLALPLQAGRNKAGRAGQAVAPLSSVWAPAAGLAASGTSLAGDASARAWAGNGCGASDAEQTGNWRDELDALADVPLFQNSDSDGDGSDGGSSCSGSFTGSDDPEDASGNSWSLMSRLQGVPSLGLSLSSPAEAPPATWRSNTGSSKSSSSSLGLSSLSRSRPTSAAPSALCSAKAASPAATRGRAGCTTSSKAESGGADALPVACGDQLPAARPGSGRHAAKSPALALPHSCQSWSLLSATKAGAAAQSPAAGSCITGFGGGDSRNSGSSSSSQTCRRLCPSSSPGSSQGSWLPDEQPDGSMVCGSTSTTNPGSTSSCRSSHSSCSSPTPSGSSSSAEEALLQLMDTRWWYGLSSHPCETSHAPCPRPAASLASQQSASAAATAPDNKAKLLPRWMRKCGSVLRASLSSLASRP